MSSGELVNFLFEVKQQQLSRTDVQTTLNFSEVNLLVSFLTVPSHLRWDLACSLEPGVSS